MIFTVIGILSFLAITVRFVFKHVNSLNANVQHNRP